jgi:hypothetical protein
MRIALARGLVPFLFAGAALQTPQYWLPPPVVESLAEQLVARLQEINQGRLAGGPQLMIDAREQIQRIRAGVDGWTEKGVLDRAPKFTDVKLPLSGQVHLDAMAGYQLCNGVLMMQFSDVPDLAAKRVAAFGLTAVSMVVLRLHQSFVDAGKDPAEIRPFLTGDAMERATRSLFEGDRALRGHVESRCEPVVKSLIDLLG